MHWVASITSTVGSQSSAEHSLVAPETLTSQTSFSSPRRRPINTRETLPGRHHRDATERWGDRKNSITSRYDRYLLSQSQMKITVNLDRCDERFLTYVLRSPQAQHDLVAATISSGVPHINLATLQGLIVKCSTQRRIVSVLGSIDDLIENNRRRIEILEEMAQAIYREWFVNFRFPGHETATLSTRHWSPKGGLYLRAVKSSRYSVAAHRKGPKYWSDGDIPMVYPERLDQVTLPIRRALELWINEQGLSKSSAGYSKQFRDDDESCNTGVLAIAQTAATTNQGFITIPPDDRWPPSFIYEWLSHNAPRLEAIATGATFKEITKGAFKKFPL